MNAQRQAPEPLFKGAAWTPELIEKAHVAIEKIAVGEFGLDVYPYRIEIISAEQMLDAYTSIGMPTMYRHWSFGKHFLLHESPYRRGRAGLAYELVINSNPCICYCMEDNTMTMQTLVMAHAAFGHNHFFKNNSAFKSEAFLSKNPTLRDSSLFQNRLGAENIIDYLEFAKRYVAMCEERHGLIAVERVLDAAHALREHSVFRGKKPEHHNEKKERERALERARIEERHYNALFETTLPKAKERSHDKHEEEKSRIEKDLPQENLLYFLAQHAPKLAPWQREILRIVYMIAQYFAPQRQTKIMNEGCATFVHYETLNRLYEQGLLTEGSLMEAMHSHSQVIFQPGFDDPRFGNFNPYAIGFAMMQEIKRIVTGVEVDAKSFGQPCSKEQLEEDREWFPSLAGKGDYWNVLKDIWESYRDESFIHQYLSPRLMRRFRLFRLTAEEDDDVYLVRTIHDERGYRELRSAFAREVGQGAPDISVVSADVLGDERMLVLQHRVEDGKVLHADDAQRVLRHTAYLWGYPVALEEVAEDDEVLDLHEESPPE